MKRYYVVVFGDCHEACLRRGTKEEVFYEDDLGCKPTAVYDLEEVLVEEIWDKNGVLRVKFKLLT